MSVACRDLARVVDLSHTIENGMTTFEGQPAPVITEIVPRGGVYDSQFRFVKGFASPPATRIEMVCNTGTLIDTPFYFSPKGPDAARLELSELVNLDAIVVRQPFEQGRKIDRLAFDEVDVSGKAVLLHTGWSRHWRSFRYYKGWPYLSIAAARWLRVSGASLVGIDSLNIDITDDGTRKVHDELLSHNIPIIMHLTNLESVPTHGSRFFAAPLKVERVSSFPVRAFCVIPRGDQK